MLPGLESGRRCMPSNLAYARQAPSVQASARTQLQPLMLSEALQPTAAAALLLLRSRGRTSLPAAARSIRCCQRRRHC